MMNVFTHDRKSPRILLVSNRLPVVIKKRKGRFYFSPAIGGLATALSSVYQKRNCLWIGWPGIASELEPEVKSKLYSEYNCYPVFLTKEDVEYFYYGFCNSTLWPLFHGFPQITKYDSSQWESYKKVNRIFYDTIAEIYKPNDIIWIHDYHLMLLPSLLREEFPDAKIGFFLHIPFPSPEIFRLLPWRREILEGILGADLIGFHIYDYVVNFLNTIRQLFGIDHELGTVLFDGRLIKIDAFPIGIDFEKYFNAISRRRIQKGIRNFLSAVGDRKIIFSIDRLDYTKGILERLEAFETFLENNPEWHEKVVFILVVPPSRMSVRPYRSLKRQIDETIGRINGKYESINWRPIIYIHRTIPSDTLLALYSIADVALITPIKDGMNLVSKEYIAARSDGRGVLILSEMSGASKELLEAIIVNPNDIEEVANAIKTALEMPEEEQIKRIRKMQERLRSYDINRWVQSFLEKLSETKEIQNSMRLRIFDDKKLSQLKEDCYKSPRLFLLDYDGTLVPFADKPKDARPNDRVLGILDKLSRVPESEVVLISGRDKDTLDKWFGNLNISLVAEHGAWIKEKSHTKWEIIDPSLTSEWKREVRPILELFVDRIPNSFIEEKDFSLVWHYRSVREYDISLSNDLMASLTQMAANLEISVLKGPKVIEIKNAGINKGRAALHFLSKDNYQFILAIGDDLADEALFKVLPKHAYSIKVGMTASYARFNLISQKDVLPLLEKLLEWYNVDGS